MGIFSSGTTGLTPVASTHAVASNILSNTGSGGDLTAIELQPTGALIGTNKIYIKMRMRVTNTDCSNLLLQAYDSAYTEHSKHRKSCCKSMV